MIIPELIAVGQNYEALCNESGVKPGVWSVYKTLQGSTLCKLRNSAGKVLAVYSKSKKQMIKFRGRYQNEWTQV